MHELGKDGRTNARQLVSHVGNFSRDKDSGGQCVSIFSRKSDWIFTDSLALCFVVFEGQTAVEICQLVCGIGRIYIELTLEVVLHVLLVAAESLFALLTDNLFTAAAFFLFTLTCCIGIALLLNLIRDRAGLVRIDRIFHAGELGTYLVEYLGDGRTVGVHLLHRVASLVYVVGALHIQFIVHAVGLDLCKEFLAILGTTLGRGCVVLVNLWRGLRYHLYVFLAYDGEVCCLFTHCCKYYRVRMCRRRCWRQGQRLLLQTCRSEV